MKITKTDLVSLRFCCELLSGVEAQTLSEDNRLKLQKHKQRVRKVHNLLLVSVSQGSFENYTLCCRGIPDDSQLAQGIAVLCPDIQGED